MGARLGDSPIVLRGWPMVLHDWQMVPIARMRTTAVMLPLLMVVAALMCSGLFPREWPFVVGVHVFKLRFWCCVSQYIN